jgi:hypothetical protein
MSIASFRCIFRRIVRPDGNAQNSMTRRKTGVDRMSQKGLLANVVSLAAVAASAGTGHSFERTGSTKQVV